MLSLFLIHIHLEYGYMLQLNAWSLLNAFLAVQMTDNMRVLFHLHTIVSYVSASDWSIM